ncbi:hypothetical protein T12_2332 [Trichinella patagoniensis]|uniref:Uncharacterized protein n=1 Tax=Trichinella patagoniensis TaxID=990121 RepID=A0A0V0YW66_9BILA|nr:hypothetical protein T12_2332 [Trichinella patagoniensis]
MQERSVHLGVWGTHTRCITIKRLSLLKIQQRFYNFLQKSLLPCNAESQKRNFMHRANCCRWVRRVSDDQNVNDKLFAVDFSEIYLYSD